MTSPVRSMTGSGTFTLESEVGRIEAEARSVNNRFLKSTVRTHGPLSGVTPIVEEALRKQLQRGHVTVHVRFRPTTARWRPRSSGLRSTARASSPTTQ